jgi:glycine/serine hydroxymethyltransferase
MTSRGLREDDFRKVAELIDKVLTNVGNENIYEEVRKDVVEFVGKMPLHKKMA